MKCSECLLRIAQGLSVKGKEYFDKGDKTMTNIIWELESIYRKFSLKIKEEENQK